MPAPRAPDIAPRPRLAPSRASRLQAIRCSLIVLIALGCTPVAAAVLEAAEESAVKAAFIYNFAKFVDWPEDAWNRSPRLRLCVSGGGDLAQALAALESKPPVRGKPVEVRQRARGDDGSGCHILVVTGRGGIGQPVPGSAAALLTVGDSDGFAGSGGVIGLVVEGDKVRFEVNPEAAQRAGLKLSSQILKLARIVRDNRGNRP